MKFKRCGRCKKVAYCSAVCQRKHYPKHKPDCKLEDKVEDDAKEENKYKNTHAYACIQAHTHTRIHAYTHALMHSCNSHMCCHSESRCTHSGDGSGLPVPHQHMEVASAFPEWFPLGKQCAGCDRLANAHEKFKCCARCKLRAYCSRHCQRQHFKSHKQECKRLREEGEEPPKRYVQALVVQHWSHGQKEEEEIVALAKELKICGFVMDGSPGFMVVEGTPEQITTLRKGMEKLGDKGYGSGNHWKEVTALERSGWSRQTIRRRSEDY